VQIVIPSRQRLDTITTHALTVFPHATVCVAQSEAAAYRRLTKRLLIHPDAVAGIGPLRQWIVEHAETDDVFMVDDDVNALYSLVGTYKRRLTAEADVLRVVANAARCARDTGAPIFGFNQAWDVRKFLPQNPLSFTGWVGGAVGVIGRARLFDPTLLLRADIDACLTALLHHRVIFRDDRFAFVHKRFGGTGGNAVSRSEAQHKKELAYLQEKWGPHLHLTPTKTAIRLVVDVPRRQ
jgi:TET-Associated Glycosyltransferase